MKHLLFFLLLSFSVVIHAQVGVNTIDVFQSADLDIKNQKDVESQEVIAKGILIPRMTEAQRNQIDVSAAQANSLLVYNTDTDCYNYYSKPDSVWLDLCGSVPVVEISPITCSDIQINGSFVQNVPTDESNYLIVNVEVKTPGIYTIKALTTNGYFFYKSDNILTSGPQSIHVPAYGTPKASGVDKLKVSGLGLSFTEANCTLQVSVNKPVAKYSLNCSNAVVKGSYLQGQALTADNYIEITVNVAQVGSYLISTEPNFGVVFEASGEFTTTGSQTLKLMGKGTLTSGTDFSTVINSNSSDGLTQCNITIPVVYRAMTYAIIGSSSGNRSWSTSPRKEVLEDPANFSPTGIVKINGFTQLWATDDPSVAINYLGTGYNGQYPDVVLFYSQGVTQTAALGTALGTYINGGGAVLYGAADASSAGANYILSGVFGSATSLRAQAQIAGSIRTNNVYPIRVNASDPIVNGPFGNLYNSLYWGEDNTSTNTVIVPIAVGGNDAIQLVSAFNEFGKPTVDPAYAVAWYSSTKNFVFFGSSVGASTDASTATDPAYYTTSNSPGAKSYGTTTSRFVFNSYLELNALAWCIQKVAAQGGIN